MPRPCVQKRGVRPPARRSTTRLPHEDHRRPRTAPAAAVRAASENGARFASPAAIEPMSDRDLERAGEESQKLGPETGLESIAMAGPDAHQPGRGRAAEGQPQK